VKVTISALLLLTYCSDRCEVEWKYLLKLDPEESQRPKPSANAKPLPEHLKENDASLDMSNRTDGVPEVGDPFLDPNSEHKWAEFNTAPTVTGKVARIDLSKDNRLWYYLGKTSTEARPQYTDNLTNPQHNPKSNFLDTVRPPAPAISNFQHRSYPAAYPIKPAPLSLPPRTPVQESMRPYTYKPKESMMHTFRPAPYTPDTSKNPNSPVAHQPNAYSYRSPGPQHGQPAHQPGHHHQGYPQGNYVPYVPPQSSSSGWKPQPTTSGPHLNGHSPYAHIDQANQALPPYPYNSIRSPKESSPYPYQQGPGPIARPVYSSPAHRQNHSSQPPSRGGAPASHLLSNAAGTSRPPMYATAHSSPIDPYAQSPASQAEYLAYVTKYPYLKNAFLRRAKTYISPYSPDGGFTPEWMPKPVSTAGINPAFAAQRQSPVSQSHHSKGFGHNFSGGAPSNLPVPRPAPQFQSADAFRQEIAKAPRVPAAPPKWEHMFKQLGTSTGAPSRPALTMAAGPSPTALQPLAPRPSNGLEGSAPAPSAHASAPPPMEPQRPIPSPLSDASKSPKRPEVSPISDDGNGSSVAAKPTLLPPIHTAETWRYTQ
jgi:hypothetical protein